MKRLPLIVLIILLAFAALLAGCTMRESGAAQPGGQTPAPAATPEAEATPDPIPTPAPMEAVISQSTPSYVLPADYDQLAQALENIAQNQGQTLWGQKGSWHADGAEDDVQLTGTRIGEGSPAGDIMATDGQYLYLLADKDLVIVQLSPDGASVVSRTKVGEDWTAWDSTSGQSVNGSEKIPFAVYCRGDRVMVLSDYYQYTTQNNETGYTEYIAVDTYDVSEPAWPRRLSTFGQDGSPVYIAERGDALIVVTEWSFAAEEGADPSAFVPMTHFNDGYEDHTAVLGPEKLLAVRDGRDECCAVVAIYDFTAFGMTDERVIYGVRADPFIGEDEILFPVTRVAEGFSRSYTDPEKGAATEFAAAACTDLYRFVLGKGNTGYAALDFDGVYTVEGAVGNANCLDRYDGQLRCAVVTDERRRTDYAGGLTKIETITSCDILMLDRTLTVAWKAEDLTEGYPHCWIGYLGDRAVVTNEGSSSVLVKLNTGSPAPEKKTLSSAVSAQAIRALGELGYTAFYRSEAGKLTLTVYDTELETLFERSFGSDHSSTLENLAGYFTDGASGIIAFSADDSYCVYGFDPDKGLTLKGDVFLSDWAWNARGFILDGFLYVSDTCEMFIYDLTDFSLVSRIEF